MYKTVSRFSAQRSLSTNLHVSACKNTLNIYHGMDIKPPPPPTWEEWEVMIEL